jgi:hypothetical protein
LSIDEVKIENGIICVSKSSYQRAHIKSSSKINCKKMYAIDGRLVLSKDNIEGHGCRIRVSELSSGILSCSPR